MIDTTIDCRAVSACCACAPCRVYEIYFSTVSPCKPRVRAHAFMCTLVYRECVCVLFMCVLRAFNECVLFTIKSVLTHYSFFLRSTQDTGTYSLLNACGRRDFPLSTVPFSEVIFPVLSSPPSIGVCALKFKKTPVKCASGCLGLQIGRRSPSGRKKTEKNTFAGDRMHLHN